MGKFAQGGKPDIHKDEHLSDLIPDEQIKKAAKSVPPSLPKPIKKELTSGFNEGLAKMKKLNVFNWLIMLGKMKGWSDRKLAQELHCSECTIANTRRKIQQSDWLEDVRQNLMALEPLFRQSLKVNALNADAYTTVAFYKGTGGFTDKHEHTFKVDKADQANKLVGDMEKILGIKVDRKNRVKPELN